MWVLVAGIVKGRVSHNTVPASEKILQKNEAPEISTKKIKP